MPIPSSSSIFQNPGSLSIQWTRSTKYHDTDDIPMKNNSTTPPTITMEMPRSEQYIAPEYTRQRGSYIHDDSVNTSLGIAQNAGINAAMARELQKLKDMISSVPGVVRPIPEIPVGSH